MRGDKLMNYNLEIEVISPVFIGSGDQYKAFEYVYDRGYFSPINIERLIEAKLKEGNINFYNEIIDGLKSGDINLYSLCRAYKIDYKKFARYTLNSEMIGRQSEIYKYIKTGGQVYIPGSSVKGAIRSALTRYKINNGIGLNTVENKINSFNNKRLSEKQIMTMDDEYDNETFGHTYDSIFRFIRITDSNLMNTDVLKVYSFKILNICNENVKWFNRPNDNRFNYEEARSTYFEGIKHGTKLKSNLTLQTVMPYVIEQSKIKSTDLITSFLQIVKKDAEQSIKNEIRFYEQYSMTAIANFYKELLQIQNKLDNNEFLLQVGFGTGILSKTILGQLKKDKRLKVAEMTFRNYHKDQNIFPKTRRIIFEGGQPKYVPGWVKIKLVQQK